MKIPVRRPTQAPGLPFVPAAVTAWADFRFADEELVSMENGVANTNYTRDPDLGLILAAGTGLQWPLGTTAFSSLGAGDWTIETWCVFNTNTACTIFGDDDASTRGVQVYYRTGPSRFVILTPTVDSVALSSTQNVTLPATGTPCHIAVVRSGTTFRIFLNGVQVGTSWTGTGNMVASVRAFRIGRGNGGDHMVGSVKAIRLTREALYTGPYEVPEIPSYQRQPEADGLWVGNGAWTWFNSPKGIEVNNRIYFGTTDEADNTSKIIEWDLATGFFQTVLTLPVTGDDDHNDASILKLANGTVIGACSHHTGTAVYIFKGADPRSMTYADIWSQLLPGGPTAYTNLIELTGTGTIYLFTRVGGGKTWYSTSTDGGTTWSALVALFESPGGSGRPYVQYWQTSATRFDVLISSAHPDESTDTCDIWHCYFEGGNFYKTDGTLIGFSLPINVTSMTKIHDAATLGDAWPWDLRVIGTEIVGLYSAFPDPDEHRYYRAVAPLDGSSAWSVEPVILNAGPSLYGPSPTAQPSYSGGMAIHPTNKDIVLASMVDGGGVHQINRVTRTAGPTWTPVAITSHPTYKSFRPDTSSGKLLYAQDGPDGSYLSYMTFAGVIIKGTTP